MRDPKYWITEGIQAAMVLVMVWQVINLQVPVASPAKGPAMSGHSLAQYWPIGVVAVLAMWNTAVLIAQTRRGGKGPFLRGQLLVGAGSGNNLAIATLNGAAVSDFRKDYNVAVVCGFNDPTVDKFEDTRISKSAAFTIVPSHIEVLILYQQPMLDVVNAFVAQMLQATETKPGFRQPKKRKGVRLLHYETHTWTETILLPKGVDPNRITRLSDVRRIDGKILTEELQEGRIKQTV